ncbi:MAG: hypothetical protein AAFY56_10620 [Pseudomonadota bacterium]
MFRSRKAPISTIALSCALLLGGCALPVSDISGDENLDRLRADQDADGLITEEEWRDFTDREFSRLDVDADGQIGPDEAPTTAFINDNDGDRILQKSEAPTVVGLADADGDGNVTVDELDDVYAKSREFDADGSGTIDQDEYTAGRQAKFDQFDLNDDGVIDPSEYRFTLLRF